MPRKTSNPIVLDNQEQKALERIARARIAPHSLVRRAEIVLQAARGASDTRIATACGVSRQTVRTWRARYAQEGQAGLQDHRPHSGPCPNLALREQIVVATLQPPTDGTSHHSSRSLARKLGISSSLILAVWRERGLQPWRTRSFRHSNDPFLVRKVHDVVSCYEAARRSRRPPIVLCVDEKPSIQAISRTAPILPMRPGQVEGRSADYIRHGTSDLYAAFNVASGEVFYRQTERHTSADFIGFLDQIVAACPIRRRIDIVLDNLRTHKTLLIDQWLALHPGVRFHFTPTHASWMNRVEVWFGTLERRCLRRSNTGSVAELRDLISLFISSWNQEAHPYKWFKTSEQILLKAMPR